MPTLFLLVLMLVQPGIILYDRIVMSDAAAQGCRVLATSTDGPDAVEAFVLRRLGAVPAQDLFHVHEGTSCSWDIQCVGSSASEVVRVAVTNELEPLPIMGAGMALLGLLNEEGHVELRVEVEMAVHESWVAESSAGASPAGWIGAWLDDAEA